MQDNVVDLITDKIARLVYLQLLAPDKARYLQAELLSVVQPTVLHPSAPAENLGASTEVKVLHIFRSKHSCPSQHSL